MTIELGHYGLMIDSRFFYIALSWATLVTTALLITAYKIYKVRNK